MAARVYDPRVTLSADDDDDDDDVNFNSCCLVRVVPPPLPCAKECGAVDCEAEENDGELQRPYPELTFSHKLLMHQTLFAFVRDRFASTARYCIQRIAIELFPPR